MLTQEQVTKIGNALNSKGATRPCERCGQSGFSIIADGLFNQVIQQGPGTVIGGPAVTTVATGCENCGHISFHALDRLVPNL